MEQYMDRLHLMTVFIAVAEEQGFAAAARRLQMSPPAVTRAVSSLEDHLGVKLFNRTTRFVRATEAGLRYLEDSRRIVAEVEAADEAAAGINASPGGHLAVTAPVMFGRMFVMPGIVDFLNTFPDVEVTAMFLDRIVNLMEEGLDVGIRIGELPDSGMRALRVGQVRLILCATTSYTARRGCPQRPDDLQNHSIIASRGGSMELDWRFRENNHTRSVRIKPKLVVNSNDAVITAVRSDFGIARLLSYQVAPYLASGEIKILLESFELPARPIHIIHREGRYTPAKIRSFVDLLANRLRNDKSLNP